MSSCNCEKLRTFHSRRNWLGKGTIYKIETPYSSISTCFSCSLPFTLGTLMISYIIYITNYQTEDSDYRVILKDAYPNSRPSRQYYDHFYGDLVFKVKNYHKYYPTTDNLTANVSMYQHYGSGNDYAPVACRDYVDKDPLIIHMNSDNNWTANGLLCYKRRAFDFADSAGLVLCRDDVDESELLVEILGPRSVGGEKKTDYLIKQKWAPHQSIIITFQLYVLYDWYEGRWYEGFASSPIWQGNDVAIKSVEYDTQKFYPEQSENGWCYGIRILMDRHVYEITDGKGQRESFTTIIALFGGLYSFVLLAHSMLAIVCEWIAQYCCKQRYNKDLKFVIENQMDNHVMETGTTETNSQQQDH